MGMLSFEILQRQFQLIRHLGDPLGRLAELHPAQSGKLNLELLDLERSQLDRVAGRLMRRPLSLQRLFRVRDTRLHIGEKRAQCIGIGRKV